MIDTSILFTVLSLLKSVGAKSFKGNNLISEHQDFRYHNESGLFKNKFLNTSF